ncbi:MAG: AraC family ligand binding domain-containing protein, partial [Clostridia bacterium]|nr:AraC family ligand binding domain-containing protein [Clostridia bacterium]
MKNALYDHGYHSRWTDVYVENRERYQTSVTDFHEHDFYEINLILSGNVKVLVANQTVDGTDSKIVLAKPDTPHFVSCKPEILYSSMFLVFSDDFIRSYDIQTMNLLSVFGEEGAILTITPEEKETCANIIKFIDREENVIRKRFLVFYLLSYIDDISKKYPTHTKIVPKPIYEVLTYINKHYMEKIVAQELA